MSPSKVSLFSLIHYMLIEIQQFITRSVMVPNSYFLFSIIRNSLRTWMDKWYRCYVIPSTFNDSRIGIEVLISELIWTIFDSDGFRCEQYGEHFKWLLCRIRSQWFNFGWISLTLEFRPITNSDYNLKPLKFDIDLSRAVRSSEIRISRSYGGSYFLQADTHRLASVT